MIFSRRPQIPKNHVRNAQQLPTVAKNLHPGQTVNLKFEDVISPSEFWVMKETDPSHLEEFQQIMLQMPQIYGSKKPKNFYK